MKIVAPLDNPAEINPLVVLGADEFYCGVVPKDWEEQFSDSYSINKRFRRSSNLGSFSDLEECQREANRLGVKITYLLNNFYVPSQNDIIFQTLDRVAGMGIRDFIVTDPLLARELADRGLSITLSTTTPIFNKFSAMFFKKLGVSRVVLPRHISMHTMKEIVSNVDMDYEALILNESCPNIDGFCRFHHFRSSKGHIRFPCALDYQIKIKGYCGPRKTKVLKDRLSSKKFKQRCGACYISDLKAIGVNFLKIAGRGHTFEQKKKYVKFIRESADKIGQENPGDVMGRYKNIFGENCGQRCYLR